MTNTWSIRLDNDGKSFSINVLEVRKSNLKVWNMFTKIWNDGNMSLKELSMAAGSSLLSLSIISKCSRPQSTKIYKSLYIYPSGLHFLIKSLPTFVFLSVRPRQLRILSGVSKSLANYSWFMKYLSNSKRYVEAFSYWNRSILSLLWMKRSKKERYLFTSAAICILLGCFSELFWGLSIILLLNAANLSRI